MKKAFTFRRVVAVTLLALFTAAPALLTTALVQAAESPVAGPKAELQRLTAEVTSNDPERVKAAVPQLWALLHQCKKNTVLVHIVDDCVLQLIRAKAYEGIDEIIQEYAVAYPAGCDRLLKARVTALLGLGKKEEALAAAKTYFNYVPLGRTMEAINFLSQTLVVARPDDKDIVRRFKQEQLAGSQTQPAAKQTVLDSIKIDGQVFQKAADSDPSGWLRILCAQGQFAPARRQRQRSP